jgi:pimeloyl-ACP methyl ester carboxylesterase
MWAARSMTPSTP